MKKVISIILLISMVLVLGACGGGKSSKNDSWPTTGLGAMLPQPDKGKIEIVFDWDDLFEARITKYGDDTYENYVAACKEKGFTIDAEESNSSIKSYEAYNNEGYHLSITLYSSLKHLDINLKPPVELGAYTWPSIGMATLIPQPKSSLGMIDNDSSSSFSIIVGDITIDDFNAYVEECIAAGFTQDHDRREKYYYAKDANGNSLSIEYKGLNQMSIEVYNYDGLFEDDTTEDETTTEAETTTAGSSNSGSINISAGLEDINNLASEGEESLKDKLGDLYDMFSGFFGKSGSYEDIYNDYSKKIIDKTPSLIEEYKSEAAGHAGDINAQAEIANAKVSILAEIANEGVEKMAMLYYKDMDYSTYESWATQLYDVYMDYAGQIYDVYMTTAG